MQDSSNLFQTALKLSPGGVNSPVRAFRGVGGEPFFVNAASGPRLRTVDGRELIDYVGTWGPAILGHAPEAVIAAVCATASRGLSFGIPNPLEVEMAAMICQLVPSVEKVRMVNSGTEATMSCIRLARGFTGREKILKFEGCYHGHVDLAAGRRPGAAPSRTDSPIVQACRQVWRRLRSRCLSTTWRPCGQPLPRTTGKSPPSFWSRSRPTQACIFQRQDFSKPSGSSARRQVPC